MSTLAEFIAEIKTWREAIAAYGYNLAEAELRTQAYRSALQAEPDGDQRYALARAYYYDEYTRMQAVGVPMKLLPPHPEVQLRVTSESGLFTD